MRLGISGKILLVAVATTCLGYLAQSAIFLAFTGKIDVMVGESMKRLSMAQVRQSSAIYRQMEMRQIGSLRQKFHDLANRDVTSFSYYSAQPMANGEIDGFARICAKIVEAGDYVVLYAVNGDGGYFSGAVRNDSPELRKLIGGAAAGRADKVAESLLGKASPFVRQFTAPIVDATGARLGEARLLALDDWVTQSREEMDRALETIKDAMIGSIDDLLDDMVNDFGDFWGKLRNAMLVSCLISMALTMAALYVAARYITRPLAAAASMANAIRGGNLSSRLSIGGKGELGALVAALNAMADRVAQREGETREAMASLGSVLTQVSMAAGEISASAGSLADSSQAVSDDAMRQQSLLQTISGSMANLGNGVDECAENAGKANSHSSTVREAAVKGGVEMNRMRDAMRELSTSQTNVAAAMKMIDEIAFQTNILSLNAAVEAARAGRHGKGFAVVAEEVRSLAARSSRSAAETQRLVGESLERLAYASECLEVNGKALLEIASGIDGVTKLMEEITLISGENSNNLAKIRINITQINSVAERNHDSAASAASTAEELRSMAAGLYDLLLKYNDKTRHPGARRRLPERTAQA